jgi:hypothetical protein
MRKISYGLGGVPCSPQVKKKNIVGGFCLGSLAVVVMRTVWKLGW